MKKIGLSAVFVLAASALPTTPAIGEEYSANVWFSPTYPLTVGGYTEFAKAVEKATDGEVTFEVFTGGSLLPPKSAMQGIADGLAQVGYHAGTYTPAQLPLTNVIADLAFATPDPLAVALASTEMNFKNERLQNEWKDNGIVFGGGYSTPAYNLICTDVVSSLSDLEGKRVRVPGGAWDRFASHVNMVGVNVPSSEMYTGMDRGSLDCAVNDPGALESFSLWDVAESINTLPVGVYFSGFTWGYNVDFWRSLSDENRRILLDEMARHLVRVQLHYKNGAEKTLAAAEEKGVEVVQPSSELEAALKEFARKDIDEVKRLARDKHDVKDPEALISSFNESVEHWSDLLDGIDRNDEDALVALVRKEIYNQVDETSYGMK